VVVAAEAYRRLSGVEGRPETLELKGFSELVTAYRLS